VLRSFASTTGLALAAACAALPALAIQVCELNGQPVNPNNGYTTEGKTGLMRCRDGEGGPVLREQELQRGKFMGVVRYFKDGVLEREHHVNERGNQDGLAREWSRAEPGGKPVLIKEETYRDGRNTGIARSWYPSGQLKRVAGHGDDDREQAVAEFNAQGQLAELRCAARPMLGSDFDDKTACGHAGAASTVTLYASKGQPRARVSFERGERKKSETLWDNGTLREQMEVTASGGVERSFAADGTKRHEVQWQTLAGDRPRRITTLDQEFHESGKLLRERRWRPGERGGELVAEASWYLNGQPKLRSEFLGEGGAALRRETRFHDNGKKAFEGAWRIESRQGWNERPTGTHQSFDAEGRLRAESMYDERGRIKRERELDERGTVLRDDEVFEDGSRKAVGR
jgi:antitoxin component YwqK of YwqJK toxin-antitoxin module